jgi:hypothetical protein
VDYFLEAVEKISKDFSWKKELFINLTAPKFIIFIL